MKEQIETMLKIKYNGCFIDLYGARCCKITINKKVRLKALLIDFEKIGKIFIDTYSYNTESDCTSFQLGTYYRLFPVVRVES